MIFLNSGDCVPADLRLLKTSNLTCQEATLTGESHPVDKAVDGISINEGLDPVHIPLGDRVNMSYSTTMVTQGSGVGIVIATGEMTQIGMISKLMCNIPEKRTAVIEQVDYASKIIALIVTTSTLITFAVARWIADNGWFDSVSIAFVTAVAMIPEGLQAIVTLVYAWGVKNMAEKKAIIKALPAVETLGSVTVICSDKTGTLTQNQMTVSKVVTSHAIYRFDCNSLEQGHINITRSNALFETSDEEEKESNETSEMMITMTAYTSTSQLVQSLLTGGIHCSKSFLPVDGGKEIGNPTELALLRASHSAGIDIAKLRRSASTVAEIPFSSEFKFMATVHEPVLEVDGSIPEYHFVLHVKGSPGALFKLCSQQSTHGTTIDVEPFNEDYWEEKVVTMSKHGLRVLALCRGVVAESSIRDGESLGPELIQSKGRWLTMVCLVAIMDPPRPECVQAIKEAHTAGIRVAMITGDHASTAKAIGGMIGITDKQRPDAITGPELDKMNDEELEEAVMKYNIFARTSPRNKLAIVKALQNRKQVCAMTGDGVNDAPALKAADMGVGECTFHLMFIFNTYILLSNIIRPFS